MKFDNQLRYATSIIGSYRGDVPLHAWLKDYFREHKQMGSKDRKFLSQLVYGFYRLGHARKDLPVEERMLLANFLCQDRHSEFLQYFRPEWNEQVAGAPEEKIALCHASGIDFQPTEIFPWKEELSEGIDHRTFCLSFLRQPDLFLRIRPGHEKEVLKKLTDKGAPSTFIPPFTLRLPNGFKVEDYFTPDREVVVQDYSSQRIAPFLDMQYPGAPVPPSQDPRTPLSLWDACAASGGKSILAYDLNPGIEVTVSDIRESILHNLRQRFRQAGIQQYHAFIADLAASKPALPAYSLDLIMTDVPCTGSGTWGRTPEELYFFEPVKIQRYTDWQRKIVANTLPLLKKGASFLYITCSVFKKENEGMADMIRKSIGGVADESIATIKGYEEKADTMFAAKFSI